MDERHRDAAMPRFRRSLRLEREALGHLLESWPNNPANGSSYRQDRRVLPPRRRTARAQRWILDETIRQSLRITANVIDHVVALEKCLEGDPAPLYSPMTLGRAALDGSVRVCYVLDSRKPVEIRLLRGSALLLDSALEEVSAIGDIPEDLALPGAAEIVQQIADNVYGWIEAAGIEIRVGPRGRISGMAWNQGDKAIPIRINVTAEAAFYFEELPAMYRMASGVAHSTPWMLHDPDDEPSTVFMAGAAAIDCLLCFAKITETYGRYYGHDPAAHVARALRHCQSISGLLADLSRSGFSSAGRYATEPRLQPPPSRRDR